MYAIIETGGKQYRVQKNDEFKVEKLQAEKGDDVVFDKVIAVGGDELRLGSPYVTGFTVKAEVLEQGKGDKIIIYKYKAKKDYRRKNGHRQPYTLVKVTDICEGHADMTEKEIKAEPAEVKVTADKVKVSMSMKKDEMLKVAEKNGIKINSKATKQQIVDAINGVN